MVLKTRSCNLLTVVSKSSPSAAIVTVGTQRRDQGKRRRYERATGPRDRISAEETGRGRQIVDGTGEASWPENECLSSRASFIVGGAGI